MCNNLAKYRFTWPGKDESLICEEHVKKLKHVAKAMGLNLQIITLSQKDLEMNLTCHQKTG